MLPSLRILLLPLLRLPLTLLALPLTSLRLQPCHPLFALGALLYYV